MLSGTVCRPAVRPPIVSQYTASQCQSLRFHSEKTYFVHVTLLQLLQLLNQSISQSVYLSRNATDTVPDTKEDATSANRCKK